MPHGRSCPERQATFPRMIQYWGLCRLLLVVPRMIHSGASERHLSLDDPVRVQRLLLLDPPRMIQSGASDLVSPGHAVVFRFWVGRLFLFYP